jgi:hypothetical protein
MYPTASIEVKEKSVKGVLRCRLVVSRPQYYENDGSYKNQTIIEAQAQLEAIAINIISEFNRLGRLPANGMSTGIQNPITIDYLSDAHNENLVLVDVAFNLWYVWECPTDVVDIASLPAPFNTLPPTTTDLEKLTAIYPPVNITEPKINGLTFVGGTLFVNSNGTWSGELPINFTYQWKRNGVDILGETSINYINVLADLGQTIACLVTATNLGGSTSALTLGVIIV